MTTDTAPSQRLRVGLILALIVFGAAMRLVPHAWNVAPMGAIALFAGALFRNRLWALLTPLAALLLSDTIMQFTGIHTGRGFYRGMEFTYLGFAAVACIGMGVGHFRRPAGAFIAAIAGGTIAGSVVFFLVSNLGFWFWFHPRTLEALLICYRDAIPFYRNTLLGDLIFVPVLFGTYALAVYSLPALSGPPVRQRG